MESGFALDVVVAQEMVVFELLAGEDETQEIVGNILTEGNERLKIGDGEGRSHIKSNGY
jgi:hypothetical protein